MRPLPAEEIFAWLDLLDRGIEPRTIMRMLRAYSGPQEILETTPDVLRRDYGLPAHAVRRLQGKPDHGKLQKQRDTMDREGIALLPANHPDYPRNLFEMRNPPPAIFVKGSLRDYDSLAIGIVGPREPTTYGVEVARMLARGFAPHFTVVSGAAMGIDSTAHAAALDAGGRTFAVLGCGIDVDYPTRNRALRKRIGQEENGALISIFPPGTPAQRGHFPQRNVVLAGLCLAVVVAEAGERSGALVTARAAADESRSVYAVPGDITRANSTGSNNLLREGAMLCSSPADVVQDLESMLAGELEALRERRLEASQRAAGEPSESVVENGSSSAAISSDPAQEAILRRIQHAPTHHDELIHEFVPGRMDLGELSTALLMLELNGRISQTPGRIYQVKL